MTYLPTMGATDAVPSFNTTKYPGVCKPANQATLELVFELQRQLNRIAQAKQLTKIAVDGDIGPAGTVKLFNAALGTNLDCEGIGAAIVAFTAQARLLANTLGAPAKVSSPAPSRTPSFVSPTGIDVAAPKGVAASMSDSLGLSTTTIVLLGAAAVGVGYYVTKKKGRK